MSDNRRDFLKKSTLLGLSGLASTLLGKDKINRLEEISEQMAGSVLYTLPALPYANNALEPFIDKQTMEIHHTKHHQAYVDKLNKALENYKGDTSLAALFKTASTADLAIRNNGGGHYNHSLFWQLLKPNANGSQNVAEGKLAELINKQYNSLENLKKEFSEKALKIFGSGWCWLILQDGKLKITTTPNQDNPLMDCASDKGTPILALDVWEHAYYLKYQNKRADYIANWWNLVNWQKAEELFNSK
jgi:Fe-Mn family superoxide dismutase